MIPIEMPIAAFLDRWLARAVDRAGVEEAAEVEVRIVVSVSVAVTLCRTVVGIGVGKVNSGGIGVDEALWISVCVTVRVGGSGWRSTLVVRGVGGGGGSTDVVEGVGTWIGKEGLSKVKTKVGLSKNGGNRSEKGSSIPSIDGVGG